jgi:hypothetical protein
MLLEKDMQMIEDIHIEAPQYICEASRLYEYMEKQEVQRSLDCSFHKQYFV